MVQQFDIFISYRRKDKEGKTTGTPIARNIQQTLEANGYEGRVFFDHNNMKAGDFEKIILSAIAQAKVFILILTKDSMLRCGDEGDWVRREIAKALDCKLKIIVINPENEFENDFPADFPKELAPIKTLHQFDIHLGGSYECEMKELINKEITPVISPTDEVHIRREVSSSENVISSQNEIKEKPKKKRLLPSLFESISKLMMVSEESVSIYNKRKPVNKTDNSYKEGDYFSDGEVEGIVVSTTYDGKHGLIVNMYDVEVRWCSEDEALRTLGISTRATSVDNGEINTDYVKNIINWQENYPGFRNVDHRWFLPSINELTILIDALDAINSGLIAKRAEPIFSPILRQKRYWSSTETNDKDTIWTLVFTNYSPCLEEPAQIYKNKVALKKSEYAYARTFARF